MNKILRFSSLFLLLLFGGSAMQAQVSVEGILVLTNDLGNPFGGWNVELHDDMGLLQQQTTNANGIFSFSVDSPPTQPEEWSVQTLDLCTGDIDTTFFQISEDLDSLFLLVSICDGINPPPPADTCKAFFSYAQRADNPTLYDFTDLSTSTNGIDSLVWNFGNGATSTAANPTIDFDSTGNYSVSLTIYSGNCSQTNFQLVRVFNPVECGCPDLVDQVCVFDIFEGLLTFDNACLADCAGYLPSELIDCNNDCGCPNFDAPICVETAEGDTITFTNHCFAECEGYTPADWVNCNNGTGPCNCTGEPEIPVCVPFNNGFLTFDNACQAACAGYTAADFIDCEVPPACECPSFYDPVCVESPAGDTLTFDNLCLATCEGYTEDDWFTCDFELCACPADNNPVCVLIDTISQFTTIFPNPCVAECAGFVPGEYNACPDFSCDCPEGGEEVCVLTPAGFLVTFTNACEAACYNFFSEDFVDCDTQEDPATCQCQDTFDPVCVLNNLGDTLSFQNPCLALCAGFEEPDFVECLTCPCEGPAFPACYFDPITEELTTFENICDALCDGFPQEDLFYCFDTSSCKTDFEFAVSNSNDLTIEFTDLSFSNEPFTTWLWEFGDGNISGLQNPTHTYAEGDFYEVTLTVSNEECMATITKTIIVGDGGGISGPDCQAFFFFEQPDSNNLLTYQFIDISLGTIQTWIWDFGNGSTSFAQNPVHTFAEPGSYNVTLNVIAANGCESSITIVVNVAPNNWYGNLDCRAWFLPILNIEANEVYFINLSSFDAISYFWAFGDGETSTSFQPNHRYETPGIYTVSLTITTQAGCENTYFTTINLESNNFEAGPQFALLTSTAEINPVNSNNIQVIPNPITDWVQIYWQSPKANDFRWSLYGTQGQLLNTGKGTSNGTSAQLELNLSTYQAGLYILRIQEDHGMQTAKLLKGNN